MWVYSPEAPESLRTGLVFDGAFAGLHPGGGRYFDGSGRENHGTLANMSPADDWQWSAELGRWGLDFHQNSVDIGAPASLTGLSEYTLSFWAYPTSWSSNGNIVMSKHVGSSNGEWYVLLSSSQIRYITIDGSNGRDDLHVGHTVGLNAWIHVAVTYQGTTKLVYADGSYIGTASTNGGTRATTQVSRLGHFANANTHTWAHRGLIADPLIHNRALTPAEIQWLARPENRLYVERTPVFQAFDVTAPPKDDLVAEDLITSAPALDQATLGQLHALSASALEAGSPVLDGATLGQAHALDADDLVTGVPELGTPSLAAIAPDELIANDLVTGAPDLGRPTIGQKHVLDAVDLVTGSPSLGTPTATELLPDVDALIALSLGTQAPVLDQPDLGQLHSLIANALATGAPALGLADMSGVEILEAVPLVTGGVHLGTPVLKTLHQLGANSLATGFSVLSEPNLSQFHVLNAESLATGSVILRSPLLDQDGIVARVRLAPLEITVNVTIGGSP